MKTTELVTTILVAVAVCSFAYLFINSMTLPDVWKSYSTGECVKVINYVDDDNYSCENMPSKFNHVWVK